MAPNLLDARSSSFTNEFQRTNAVEVDTSSADQRPAEMSKVLAILGFDGPAGSVTALPDPSKSGLVLRDRASSLDETPSYRHRESMTDLSRSPRSTASTEAAGGPLLLCLELVARQLGLPFSHAGALAGLPLRDSKLTLDLLPRAAARQSLHCELRKRSLRRILPGELPVILMLRGDDACVLAALGAEKTCEIIAPGSTDRRSIAMRDINRNYTGQMALIAPASSADYREPQDNRGWFSSVLKDAWSSWAQILLTAFFVNLLGLALPLFTMNVFDRVIPNLAFPTLWALSVGIVLALLMDTALRQLRAAMLENTGRKIDLRVSSEIFEHVIATSLGAKKLPAGMIASQVRDFDSVREFFTSASIIAATDLLFIGISLWVLWLVAGPIAVVPLVAVVVVILVTSLIQVPLNRSSQTAQVQASRRHAILVESLVGIESIKASNAEGYVQYQMEDALAATANASSSSRRWSSFALYFTSIVQQFVSVSIIVWGVVLIYEGRLSVGALVAANLLASRILNPLGNITATLSRAQHAITALRGIGKLMTLERDRPPPGGGSAEVTDPGIEFRRVSFSYPGQQRPALNGVSFNIRSGERVAIIGKVGSGKTTIGRLLAGLHQPSEGAVIISGVDSRAYDPAVLRMNVGYVPQDPDLFAGTLRDNIQLGHLSEDVRAIESAARMAGLDELIASQQSGLAMDIGERGKNLSGGQRQSVALARMFLRNPKILFLDEPSSAMDSTTEAALVRELTKWAEVPGRTLIVCSHRTALLSFVDRIIVVHDGAIKADGPRSELFKSEPAKKPEVHSPGAKPK